MRKFVWFFGIMLIVVQACTYSEGERTGIITKFSKKGVIFKTWEGKMTLGGEGASGTLENTWDFTVPKENEEILEQVKKIARSAKPVTLGYEQVMPQIPWVGETGYLITKVIQEEKGGNEGNLYKD